MQSHVIVYEHVLVLRIIQNILCIILDVFIIMLKENTETGHILWQIYFFIQ